MTWQKEKETFATNVQSVLELQDFDKAIMEICVFGLQTTAEVIEDQYGLFVPGTFLRERAALLERVREEKSLRPKYEAIFNQCVVLLVSHFASAVHGIFRAGVIAALRGHRSVPVVKHRLSVSWHALEQTQDGRERIFADLLIAQKDISFQDMNSIARAFKDHFGIHLERTPLTDDIILGQAARHVIVHAGGTIDERMIKQVADAQSRTLRPDLIDKTPLRFTRDEIDGLAKSMKAYLEMLCDTLDQRIGQP
jgi:hypothetical protein